MEKNKIERKFHGGKKIKIKFNQENYKENFKMQRKFNEKQKCRENLMENVERKFNGGITEIKFNEKK